MIRSRQAHCWGVAIFAAGQLIVCPLQADTSMNVPAPQKLLPAPASLLPPPSLPQPKSPVDFFRALLAMSLVERQNALTNRPAAIRARILVKLNEYEALG